MPPSESIQVISNYSAVSRTELFGVCVPRCMKDIRCNAFDICNGECRTIRGWLPIYTDSGSGDPCERHQIGSTPSSSTGPTAAHRGLYYKFIETSSGAVGDKAILESSRAFQVKTYCLTMYYHMYGATINTLTIRTKNGNNAAIDRWTLTGNQGDVWHHLSGVNLPLDSQTKIIVEATKGSSITGDIAIDYVELWPFACP
uniref:MAM domain-containing protein n=1 Tax=Magallana gigas TaxID=29159 RepID=A0A8W8LNW0_MAGGI